MSFLQPILLWALPLALLPIVIHLIHLHRRRTVPWAATRFLLAAQQMNRGFSRLRRILILAFRVFALAALIFMVGRPLAGGLLGLTGGAPDTVLILLDRSASMEHQNLATGLSKRQAGLAKLTGALAEAYRGRSRLVLIDSATRTPQDIDRPSALAELPATWPTDTSADLPALLQDALDYITANQAGRTDVWILSDLQKSDWDAASGRWEALRSGFSVLPGVRFHLLSYPGAAPGNLALTVDRFALRETSEGPELVLDLEVLRQSSASGATSTAQGTQNTLDETELPIRFVINGSPSVLDVQLKNDRFSLKGHTIPLGIDNGRGWGRVELPADTHPGDNVWNFVFDRPPVMRSAIISDAPLAMTPVTAALGAPAEPSRRHQVDSLTADRVAEVAWEDTALIVWQIPLPAPGTNAHQLLLDHLAAGRSLLFLPPDPPAGDGTFLDVAWGDRISSSTTAPDRISWWRNESGLLANTRSGKALPVGELEITARRSLLPTDGANALPLARMASDNSPVVLAALPADTSTHTSSWGQATFLATPPGTGGSTLARDGVVLYALLHRTLAAGASSLGTARQRTAAQGALGPSPDLWTPPAGSTPDPTSTPLTSDQRPLRAGTLSSPSAQDHAGAPPLLTALNRPLTEDLPRYLDPQTLAELFAGLDHRILQDTVENDSSLVSEIWRTFLILMAAALLLEALFSLPQRRSAPHPTSS